MDIWQVKNIKVKDLFPNKKNPRKISKENLKKLKSKIERLGFHNPVKVDEKMNLLGGNQRVKALLEMGAADLEIPVMIPNRPLTKKEKDEIIITDNVSDGEWDWDILKDEWNMEELKDWGIEWDLSDDEPEEIEIVEDEVPEEVSTRCKLGDIWQLGNHRLMCGDSTSVDDVEKLMSGEKADMVFTDPPYGMFLDTDYTGMEGMAKGNKYKKIIGDNEDFSPDLINTVFTNFGYCKEIFLWGADYFAELLPNRNNGSWVVWDKMQNGEGVNDAYDKMFGSNFELCWSKNKHKRALARVLWKGIFGLSKEDTKTRLHPTQKPIELVKWFFNKFRGDVVVDLYGGSGSTLITCEQLNRKCYMMELDEHYCDVIIQRWENLTGNKAVKL